LYNKQSYFVELTYSLKKIYWISSRVKKNIMSEGKNRGEFLSKIITQKGINFGKLLKRMGYHRTTYYTHITQPNLDYAILAKYAVEIPYDFTTEFPEMRQYSNYTESENNMRSIKDVEADRDKWREKYYDLLEKYNNLLEQSK
jgi:hypothetical protein